MAIVNVCYMDPVKGMNKIVTKTADVISMKEEGAYTVIAHGKYTRDDIKDGQQLVEGDVMPTGHFMIPTRYVNDIELNYGTHNFSAVEEPQPEEDTSSMENTD